MHRLADAPHGTKVWVKRSTGSWETQQSVGWFDNFTYVIDDGWAEIRKAMVDGKIVEFYNGCNYNDTQFSIDEIGTTGHTLSSYRIKPDVVEPVYYYQYEKISDSNNGCISISDYMTDNFAIANCFTSVDGWFKIESSKREWGHA